jgi:hypothetical protein
MWNGLREWLFVSASLAPDQTHGTGVLWSLRHVRQPPPSIGRDKNHVHLFPDTEMIQDILSFEGKG